MLAHAGDMSGYAGTLQELGADIASEQAAPSNAWQGDTGMTYQVCKPVEPGHGSLVRAYQSMAGTHEANTMVMMARDQAEAAKGGGEFGSPAMGPCCWLPYRAVSEHTDCRKRRRHPAMRR